MIIIDSREHKLLELITSINNVINPNKVPNKVPHKVPNKVPNNIPINYSVSSLQIGDIIIQHKIEYMKNINYTFNIILERKYITDMIASIKDGRYKEQKIRLLSEVANSVIHNHNHIHNYIHTHTVDDNTKPINNVKSLVCYVIEGIQSDLRLPQDKTMLNGSIISATFRDKIPILRTNTLQETVDLIIRLNDRLTKDYTDFFTIQTHNTSSVSLPISPIQDISHISHISPIQDISPISPISPIQDNNTSSISLSLSPIQDNNIYLQSIKKCKKDNITPKLWNQMCYMNIPGISSVIAIKISEYYPTIKSLLIAYEKCSSDNEKELLLSKILLIDTDKTTRTIGKIISNRVYEYFIQ